MHKSYLLNPHYWLKGIKHPRQAWGNLFSIIRHPRLYIKVWTHVEGLIDHRLGVLLYESVLKSNSISPNVVEVGAFKGLSTVYLSLAAGKVGKRVKSFELFTGLPAASSVLDLV
jgi:hypothetical protein